ncbi:MAG: class I SAM-dependent methyltransferase [Candidatus Saccharimonadales bacterium]
MPYTETDPSFRYQPNSQGGTLDVTGQDRLPETGIRLDRVRVLDGYESLPGRLEVQSAVAHMDQLLIDHPEWCEPYIDEQTETVIYDVDNHSSQILYGDSPTLQEWFISAGQTQATALYPLQRPDIDNLPSGAAIDDKSRAFFYHGLDAIGIRTRAKIMGEIASQQLTDRPAARWISLACGGAVPVIDALKECQDLDLVHLDLIDYSPEALDFASNLAGGEARLQKIPSFNQASELRSYTTHELNLIRGLIASDSLVDQFGENCSDVVDALGIFEYFSKKDSTNFLRNAYRLVREDGVLVIANMLADRPQLEFNRRGVGWPKLHPRSPEEMAEIIVNAGIDPEKARIIIPEDGVYAVVEIQK